MDTQTLDQIPALLTAAFAIALQIRSAYLSWAIQKLFTKQGIDTRGYLADVAAFALMAIRRITAVLGLLGVTALAGLDSVGLPLMVSILLFLGVSGRTSHIKGLFDEIGRLNTEVDRLNGIIEGLGGGRENEK